VLSQVVGWLVDRVATPPPSERVALILGRDEDDEDDDHHTHEIFCELEELRLPSEDGELEWKETARCFFTITVTGPYLIVCK